jgi:CysZ protein
MLLKDFKTNQRKNVYLSETIQFFKEHKILFFYSTMILTLTFLLTIIMSSFVVSQLNSLTGNFFSNPPQNNSFYTKTIYIFWVAGKFLFNLIVGLISLYVSFLLSYTLSSPLYSKLANVTEKFFKGENEPSEKFSISKIWFDIKEAIKVSFIMLSLSIVALFANFIPIAGQLTAFFIYLFVNALLLIDFSASENRFSLSEKIQWIFSHKILSGNIAFFPTLISLIPIINIFIFVFIFPFYVVHATLNFVLNK